MIADTQGVIAGGALAVLILREVFTFLKARRTNGNGHERDERLEAAVTAVQSALALHQRDVLAKLDAVKDDCEHIRHYCHDIINGQAGVRTATELLIGRLERLDRRR